MRLAQALLPLSLLALVACGGGSDASEADVYALVQKGEIDEAITAAEIQLASIEKGSQEHRDLVVYYVSALAQVRPGEARDRFLEFAEAYPDIAVPDDYQYAVEKLRLKKNYLEAIDVMHAGKTRWPEDETMEGVLAQMQKDVRNSGNGAAEAKMRGLGYM